MSDEVVIHLKDNGQGIPDKDMPYVFNQFYRAEKSRNTRSGGSGIGLAIAKHIIEGHGGQISVQSQWKKGTTITFTLPRYIPDKKGFSDAKILIIEDEQSIAELQRDYLEINGFEVWIETDGYKQMDTNRWIQRSASSFARTN